MRKILNYQDVADANRNKNAKVKMHYIIISIVITLTIIYSILTFIEAMNFYNKNNKINN